MSDQRIIAGIKGLMDKYEDKEIRKKEGASKVHRVSFTTQETSAAFINGTDLALNKIFAKDSLYRDAFKNFNSKQVWNTVLRSIFYDFANGGKFGGLTLVQKVPLRDFSSFKGANKSQVFVIPGSSAERFTIEIRLPSAQRTIYTFCAAFRKHAWKMWCDQAKGNLGGSGFEKAAGTTMDSMQANRAIGSTTHYAHDEESTVGLARVDVLIAEMKEMDGFEADVGYYQETIDLPSEILRLAKIEVKAVPEYVNGVLVGETRTVSGTMKQQTSKETTDFSQIRARVLKQLPAYLKRNKKDIKFLDEEQAMNAKGSNDLTKDVAASHARNIPDEIVRSFKKAGVKEKPVVSKKPGRKRQTRNIEYTHRPANKSSINKGSMKVFSAVWEIQAEQEKGTGNKLSDLLRLKNQINKRLPAEVRRNMGRPALINRTGRFSNSTQVLNLRQTAAGISGEYTYQRNPYETFENTGRRKWPAGYNPKPLITKSIRQLALQYTEQKLTSLRRT